MAELILYMVTGRINPEEFEGNQGLIADLLALSVHTTFATKADKSILIQLLSSSISTMRRISLC